MVCFVFDLPVFLSCELNDIINEIISVIMLLYEFISFQQLMLIFSWFLEFYSVAACALIEMNEENPPPVEEYLFEQSTEIPVMK
jgi:hypothetical protein